MPEPRSAARASRERRDFVAVALEHARQHGMASLTMRSLADDIGLHRTAVYRHFENKDALVAAMMERVLAETLAGLPAEHPDPRTGLIALATALRAAMVAHPALAAVAITTTGQVPSLTEWTRRVVAELRRAGRTGDELVAGYQQLESYAVGATVFDLSREPEHWRIRAQRYAQLGLPEFAAVGADPGSTADTTQRAFAAGLAAVVDALVRTA